MTGAAARLPPAAAAASVGLIALAGRAVMTDLLIAASLLAAVAARGGGVDENWRVSVFKRFWRLVDVLTETRSGGKALEEKCRGWKLAVDEVGVVFCCVAAIVALFRSFPVRGS